MMKLALLILIMVPIIGAAKKSKNAKSKNTQSQNDVSATMGEHQASIEELTTNLTGTDQAGEPASGIGYN